MVHAALILSVALLSSPADEARKMLASMPDGAVSVAVIQSEALSGSTPAVWLPFDEWRKKPDQSIPGTLARAVYKAGIESIALGGSKFERPPDLGMGNLDLRTLTYVRKPLDGLIDELERRAEDGSVRQLPEEDSPTFVATIRVKFYGGTSEEEDLFIALPDSRVLMTAESLEDLREMVKRWNLPEHEVPERFRAIAKSVDFTSDAMLFRVIPKRQDRLSDGILSFGGKEIPASAFGVWSDKNDPASWKIVVRTDDPELSEKRLSEEGVFDLTNVDGLILATTKLAGAMRPIVHIMWFGPFVFI